MRIENGKWKVENGGVQDTFHFPFSIFNSNVVLRCVAYGGVYGGTLTLARNGAFQRKLSQVGGDLLPGSVQVPPEAALTFEAEYEPVAPSDETNDIVATAAIVEDFLNETHTTATTFTSGKVELEAEHIAVDAWLDPEKTQPLGLGRTFTLESGGFVRIPFYVQADAFSTAVDQEWFAAEADLADGHHSCEARFTAISRIVEPINVTKRENRVVNPCCGIVGSNVLMKVDVYPQSFPAERIRWSVAGGQAEFVGGSTGKEVSVAVSGEQDAVLSVDFGGCAGEPSVFTVMPTALHEVKVYPVEVCDYDEDPSIGAGHVEAMLREVNAIYEQVGLRFVVASNVVVVKNDIWNRDGLFDGRIGSAVRNVLHNSGGVEVYFIEGGPKKRSGRTVPLGTCNAYGVIVRKSVSANVLAHEFGHACGLHDIYIERDGCLLVGNDYIPSYEKLPSDWGQYDPLLSQDDLIRRLLMFGVDGMGQIDIPAGSVFGVVISGEKGMSTVGRNNMLIYPPISR